MLSCSSSMRTSSLITFACVFRSFRSSAICRNMWSVFLSANVSGLHRFIIIDGVNRKFMLGLPENAGKQCSIGQAEFSLAAHR